MGLRTAECLPVRCLSAVTPAQAGTQTGGKRNNESPSGKRFDRVDLWQ